MTNTKAHDSEVQTKSKISFKAIITENGVLQHQGELRVCTARGCELKNCKDNGRKVCALRRLNLLGCFQRKQTGYGRDFQLKPLRGTDFSRDFEKLGEKLN